VRNASAVVFVYASALVAGLSVVSFPASATVLKAAHGLSDSEYGAIFLPQVALTIVGSLLGGRLSARRSLKTLLTAALVTFGVSESLLFATERLGHAAAYAALLAATATTGAAFGLAAAPLNTLPGLLFPCKKDVALVALHTFIGTGFAVGPILVGSIAARGLWAIAPALLSVLSLVVAGVICFAPIPSRSRTDSVVAHAGGIGSLVPFFGIAVLYAFAEGTFANWSTVYLHEERGVTEGAAALALACFWAGLAAGRLLVSAVLVRMPTGYVWLSLPLFMAASATAIPSARDAVSGVIVFTLSGLACSAFFPLTVSAAVAVDPAHAERIASAMTAALMLGVGLGSFTVGPLRSVFSIARIYSLSALYPLSALALALVSRRRRTARTPRPEITRSRL
jgi:predicted MFS family arabinose efflux permease